MKAFSNAGIATLVALCSSILFAPHDGLADLQPSSSEIRVDGAGELGTIARPGAVARNRNDGSFVVVWERPNYSGGSGSGIRGVFAQRYAANGNTLGGPWRVSTDAFLSDVGEASVSMHDDGSFVVVWEQFGNPSETGVLGQRYDAGGSAVGTTFRINTNTSGYQRRPSVAPTGSGNFVVVWQRSTYTYSDEIDIYGQRFNATATPVGTEFPVNSYTSAAEARPQVGSAGDGSFVVVWQSGGYFGGGIDGAYNGVAARRFAANGSPIGTDFVVNTFTTYSQDEPDVAVRSNGDFVVAWRSQYGDEQPGGPYGTILDHSIEMQRFNAGGAKLGTAFHLNSYITGNQIRPSIAMDDDGSFVIVWHSYPTYNSMDLRDPSDGGVFGRCFDASGLPIGGDFQVNAYTTAEQGDPSIATDGSGNFVVAWEGAAVYDSGYKLYGVGVATRTFSVGGGAGGIFSITKDDGGVFWDPATPVVYTITVESLGQPSNGVVISESVPAKTTFNAAASTPGWSCANGSPGDTVCTFDVGAIAAEGSANVDFAVSVLPGTSRAWVLLNDADATRSGGTESASGRGYDITYAGGLETLCQTTPSECLTLFCRIRPSDALCAQAPQSSALTTGPRVTRGIDQDSAGINLLRLRDKVLPTTRGGGRLVELIYEHNDAARDFVASTPLLVNAASAALAASEANLQAIADGNGASFTFSQTFVDDTNTLLDALRDNAGAELAAAIERERARVDLDSLVGLTFDQVLVALNRLTCTGFETELFCGEITGDCVVTATDALQILFMAVNSIPRVDEADVDGSGVVVATDALLALQIAVNAIPQSTACNVL